MARSLSPRQPSYRLHKPTGQAVVTVCGRDIYLGKHNSADSKRAYRRLMLEFLASEGDLPPPKTADISVLELANAYKKFARRFYVGRDGQPTDWYGFVADVMRLLGNSCYGRTPAVQFGPLALKAFRKQLILDGGSRPTVNKKIDVVKRAFRWACGEELIPAAVYQAIRVVDGLRKGRTEARETSPVMPVDDLRIEAVLPHLPEIVADMVRLQRLTGMRPAEVCILRPCDIETESDVWTYRPQHHKTAHHGHDRVVFFGPQAQVILRPYLLRDKSAYCFVPAESEKRRRRAMHEARTTPAGYGNTIGTNRKRNPRWAAGRRYDTASYRRAVCRACESGFKMPEGLTAEAAAKWRAENVWSPNQIRHTAATEIRRRFGLEAARVTLGHTEVTTTQIYAERDLKKAAEVMREVG